MKTKGIFLCHSSRDKSFARRLADDLRAAGVTVWVDEAEIRVGDSLVERIQSGIAAMEYLAVVLTPDAVDSGWVEREVATALTEEIEKRRVKVLPLLYKTCAIPTLLRDKKFADFRKPQKYQSSLRELLKRLGGDEPRGPRHPPPKRSWPDDPFFADALDDLKRSARNLGLACELVEEPATTILTAVLRRGLMRVGVSVQPERPDREIDTSYLLSLISRELRENPFRIEGLFAIVAGRETTLEPHQVNEADSTNVMIMRWNERSGREALASAIEIFWNDLKGQSH